MNKKILILLLGLVLISGCGNNFNPNEDNCIMWDCENGSLSKVCTKECNVCFIKNPIDHYCMSVDNVSMEECIEEKQERNKICVGII